MKIKRQVNLSPRSSILFILFNIWLATLLWLPNTLDIASNYFHFFFLGILGAIFANSTGAGGGVVFIPTFSQLGFSEAQAVATSFGIQCFGMTAGAITWWRHYRTEQIDNDYWAPLPRATLVIAIFAMLAVSLTYQLEITAPGTLVASFKLFSLFLGAAILVTALWIKPTDSRTQMQPIDWFAAIMIALFGGVITAWLSVGVGELIAVYLILRRFHVVMSIAVAVIISAATVWAAAIYQLALGDQAYWNVILFAGPGAVIGGILAKKLVSFLPAKQVKIFFALWVLIIGLLS